MWVYLDGDFVQDADAKVSVKDHSFLYGDGCFEGIGVFAGRVLHLQQHVDRFYRSARMLRIPVPVSADVLAELIVEVAFRNGMGGSGNGYLRPVLSRGAGPLGVGWSARIETPTLVIIPQTEDRRIAYGGEIEVLKAATSRFSRADPSSIESRIKANNYITSILAFLEANDKGAAIAILCDQRGYVSEGHAMNIMAVREGEIYTPPESAGLAGVTREAVLTTARDLGIPCREQSLTVYDLICAQEVMVTSSLDGLAVVSAIDGQPLPDPIPGEMARHVREAYVDRAIAEGVPVDRAHRAAADVG